jgi:hypothetical protein
MKTKGAGNPLSPPDDDGPVSVCSEVRRAILVRGLPVNFSRRSAAPATILEKVRTTTTGFTKRKSFSEELLLLQ